jgi:hypothetical protein
MFEQTVVDPCGCTLIWNGQEFLVYPCIQNMAARVPGVLVDEGGVLMEVAI